MQRIGDELQATTGILRLRGGNPQIFDICMAPGGYSAAALKHSPSAHVCGISLPMALGGHPMLIPYGSEDQRVEVKFADITMLAAEFGVTEIPKEHPDFSNFSPERPWATTPFDLVFCDGQVLRTQEVASYRQQREAGRLACSQLILAMQRIKPGGTLIMLLHRVEMWQTIKLLSIFDKISDLHLFKPREAHNTRSSFYLVAKNVQPHSEEAIAAVEGWKATWKEATFSVPGPNEKVREEEAPDSQVLHAETKNLIAKFGERLIELGEPVWLIQKEALKAAPWFKVKGTGIAGASTEHGRMKTSAPAINHSVLVETVDPESADDHALLVETVDPEY